MSERSDHRPGLVVIGSGPAGVTAARSYLAARGPGPVVVLTADGHPPYQRPPLSKTVLAGEEPPEGTPIHEEEDALDGVEIRLATAVTSIDTVRQVVRTDDGTEVVYGQLVVASGSEPSRLPGADDGAAVLLLRSLEHAQGLDAALRGAGSALVVGSGFIGCEAAASLSRRGLRVTLVTPEEAPQAARLGRWAGEQIAGWLRGAGVDLRTGVEVDRVEAPSQVHLDDGSVLEPELVLAAVGVEQARPFLESSGLSLEEGHLVVDVHLRTNDAHVWAAGDVARARHAVVDRSLSVEHWGDALAMGEVAGHNAADAALGREPAEAWETPPGFWSEIGEHTLKYSAWGDGYETEQVVEHGDGAFTVWYADAEDELVGVLTHECDDDYELAADLLARRTDLATALRESREARR